MNFHLDNLSPKPYCINNPAQIKTPRLVLFEDRVDENIQTMQNLLKEKNQNLNLKNLCPHVKTHKSALITQKMIKAGISFFKCTMNEIDMLIHAGAKHIFIAYPLLNHSASDVAQYIINNPDIVFYIQVSRSEHIDILTQTAKEENIHWNILIDLNVGMNRTGLNPSETLELYNELKKLSDFTFYGFHAYDGHVHFENESESRTEAQKSMDRLLNVIKQFQQNNVPVKMINIGGTPSFLYDMEAIRNLDRNIQIYLSPGTWIYFDSKSNLFLPNTFQVAACILTQVIDKPGTDLATLNIGHKRWSIDQGPITDFSIKGMKAVQWSEEHTVVSIPKDVQLNIGDFILFAPTHVCSTVNLWEYMTVIDGKGEIKTEKSLIEARNR